MLPLPMSATQTVPGNMLPSPWVTMSRGVLPTFWNSAWPDTSWVPVEFSLALWTLLSKLAVRMSPFSWPPKFDAVYSVSPFVDAE